MAATTQQLLSAARQRLLVGLLIDWLVGGSEAAGRLCVGLLLCSPLLQPHVEPHAVGWEQRAQRRGDGAADS